MTDKKGQRDFRDGAFDRARRDLLVEGRPVLESVVFERAFGQRHHHSLSVADHTLNVALTSLQICYLLERLHIRVDKNDVIIGALAHDLGILGRFEKYRNDLECCRRHPVDSVAVARDLMPDLNERTEQIIRRHMWPLSLLPPGSREAVIVSAADKYSALHEALGRLSRRGYSYKKRERAVLKRDIFERISESREDRHGKDYD